MLNMHQKGEGRLEQRPCEGCTFLQYGVPIQRLRCIHLRLGGDHAHNTVVVEPVSLPRCDSGGPSTKAELQIHVPEWFARNQDLLSGVGRVCCDMFVIAIGMTRVQSRLEADT